MAYEPAAQGIRIAWSMWGHILPAGQIVHVPWPYSEYWPAAQLVMTVPTVLQLLPAGQEVQLHIEDRIRIRVLKWFPHWNGPYLNLLGLATSRISTSCTCYLYRETCVRTRITSCTTGTVTLSSRGNCAGLTWQNLTRLSIRTKVTFRLSLKYQLVYVIIH